jgi:hypothetical protein
MEKDEKTSGAIVETYAEDMAKVIEDDKEGLVKKIIHGEEEHQEEKKNLSPESKKNKLFMLIGILLMFLALGTLSYFFFFKKDINTVPVAKQFVPIIFNDKSTFIEVLGFNKDEITQSILNQVNATEVQNGGVEGIYLTENKQIIGLRRFITLVKSNFIPGDNTLFVNDNFLMGVVNSGATSARATREGFFILLKVRSTADIFDALRAWETNLLTDLHGFLGINISKDTNYLFTKSFEDGIVENKNARMLYDKDGNLVLMYIFADDNSVIITNGQFAAHEIMLRLASAQTKQ